MVAGDFNELPPAVVAMEAGLRWRRLDDKAITAVIAGSGAAEALGVPAERIAAAVLDAGRRAGQTATAARVRAADRCLLPVPGSGRGFVLLPRAELKGNDMVARQLPPLSAAGPVARTSPEYVRISMASAIALRMRSGRFSREFEFGGINLLLSYGQDAGPTAATAAWPAPVRAATRTSRSSGSSGHWCAPTISSSVWPGSSRP